MDKTQKMLAELKDMMKQLRHQQSGCAWCKQQTLDSLIQSTVEEIHELSEAIHDNNPEWIQDELTDLLFHVFFYSQIAEEQEFFNLDNVLENLIKKMKRRNPQVFDTQQPLNLQETAKQWEKIKHEEYQKATPDSLFEKIPRALPALIRAYKIQQRIAKIGLDQPDPLTILDELSKKIKYLKKNSQKNIDQTLGDMLFYCVALARHLLADPETILQQANNYFVKRFQDLEKTPNDQEKIDALWNTRSKKHERKSN